MNPPPYSEQPRPDSPTLPVYSYNAKINTDYQKLGEPPVELKSEWMKAMYGKRKTTLGAGMPRIDYGPITAAIALGSHAPTDEEREWMSRLSGRYRMRKAQKEAQDVEKLLKKDALTKQKEMTAILWGMEAVGLQYKKSSKRRRFARCLGASVRALVS